MLQGKFTPNSHILVERSEDGIELTVDSPAVPELSVAEAES
jgi:hypothetical protein